MLDERKLRVLRAIITDYVASQEPVGSKALVDRYDLNVSSATVRNDMAVLEDEGYIMQPHTSAGRIPTDKGYRLFVDRLGTIKPLSPAERRAIESFMAGAADVDDVVARTVQLLARITQQVAIVQYPVVAGTTIRHVETIPLTPERLLLIVVTSSGRVEQKTIFLPQALGEDELIETRNRLRQAVLGRGPQAALGELAVLLAEATGSLAVCAAAAIEAISAEPAAKLVVGGVPNLTRFGDEFDTAIRPVLEALEEQVVLLRLLGETAAGGVSVRIGQENPYEPLQSTSIVAATYGETAESWANLGIVGPTRMDYPQTIAAVRAVARYVSRILAEG